MDLTEKRLSSKTVFEGRVMTVTVDEISVPNGARSTREVVHTSGGVVILPVDGEGRTRLVRQFRYAHSKALLEAPAGKLEKGEEPLPAAVRELKEETGLTAEEVIPLGAIVTTPGFCTEVLYLFLARGLTQGETDFDEDEFLEIESYGMDEVKKLILENEITDAKTVAIYMKAAAFLEK
ncbi:MAG: NUDIX hydrolase [Oscillospiraceae bacterium]|jgi:ADP-ribose pyrophosphatase|nr:NUDIX hydrolase [Oscillospiraceae bacterium]